VDPRLSRTPVVTRFAEAIQGFVAGLYVAGSVASGDYRAGVSDIDAVALVDRTPRPAMRKTLVETHEHVSRTVEGAEALHCVYVARPAVEDPSYRHWTWAFGELFRRPLSGIARAELLADPVVVVGPPPSAWLPPMPDAAVREAARAELAGYWTTALRKRSIWLEDVYIDVGLTSLARADATIREGRLITKSEAIRRLADLGVPLGLVDEVARRRAGEAVVRSMAERRDRAELVRTLLRARIAGLLGQGDQAATSCRRRTSAPGPVTSASPTGRPVSRRSSALIGPRISGPWPADHA
jgi:Nucleotidyltransferase domain